MSFTQQPHGLRVAGSARWDTARSRVEIVLVDLEGGRFAYVVTTCGERGGFGIASGVQVARAGADVLALVHRVFRVPEGPWEAMTTGLRFRFEVV